MCYLCGATEQDVCTHTCMASTGFICLTRNEEDMSKWKFMDDAVVLIWYRVQPRLPWLSWCGFVRDVSLFFGRKFLMFLSFSQCRCGFYLHPAEGSPAPNITQGKLSAPRILRIHKVRCSQNHWSTANARCCKMVNPPIHNDISGCWWWMEESALRGDNFLCQQSTEFACMRLWHQNSLLPIYLHVSVNVANCIVFLQP